ADRPRDGDRRRLLLEFGQVLHAAAGRRSTAVPGGAITGSGQCAEPARFPPTAAGGLVADAQLSAAGKSHENHWAATDPAHTWGTCRRGSFNCPLSATSLPWKRIRLT